MREKEGKEEKMGGRRGERERERERVKFGARFAIQGHE